MCQYEFSHGSSCQDGKVLHLFLESEHRHRDSRGGSNLRFGFDHCTTGWGDMGGPGPTVIATESRSHTLAGFPLLFSVVRSPGLYFCRRGTL